MTIDEQKADINRKSEESMRLYLRSRTWPQKVRSIERMRVAGKIAREAMAKVKLRETSSSLQAEITAGSRSNSFRSEF